MKRRIFIAIQVLMMVLATKMWAQDPHYSQYTETPVNVNPALCGVAYDMRVIANYRTQWQSVAGQSYKTYGLTGEFAIKHKKTKGAYLTTGFNMYQDVAGVGNYSELHIGAILGVVVRTGANGKLSFGASGSFDQRRVSATNFQWENQYNGLQYDPSIKGENIPTTQINYADFGAGVNYHFSKSERYISSGDGHRFDIGFSVFHVNSPLISFYNTAAEKQDLKYSGNMSFTIAMPRVKSNIIPSMLVMIQGKAFEMNVGFMYKIILSEASKRSTTVKPMALALGAYYRTGDSFIPQLLFEWDKYAVGVSYDLNTSSLSSSSNLRGGLEVMLRFSRNPGYGKNTGLNTAPKATPYFNN